MTTMGVKGLNGVCVVLSARSSWLC